VQFSTLRWHGTRQQSWRGGEKQRAQWWRENQHHLAAVVQVATSRSGEGEDTEGQARSPSRMPGAAATLARAPPPRAQLSRLSASAHYSSATMAHLITLASRRRISRQWTQRSASSLGTGRKNMPRGTLVLVAAALPRTIALLSPGRIQLQTAFEFWAACWWAYNTGKTSCRRAVFTAQRRTTLYAIAVFCRLPHHFLPLPLWRLGAILRYGTVAHQMT